MGTVPTQYYFVDDLDDALGKVEELGGKVLEGRKQESDFGDQAIVQDTEGNVVGLYAMRSQ